MQDYLMESTDLPLERLDPAFPKPTIRLLRVPNDPPEFGVLGDIYTIYD